MSQLKDYAPEIERLLNQQCYTFEACAQYLKGNFKLQTSTEAVRRYCRKYKVREKKVSDESMVKQTNANKVVNVKKTPEKNESQQPVVVKTNQSGNKFTVFGEGKRVMVKDKDFTTAKLGLIFQIAPSSVYLVDQQKVVTFPNNDGSFDAKELNFSAQYEVCGTKSTTATKSTAVSVPKKPTTPASSTPKNKASAKKKKTSTPNASASPLPIFLPSKQSAKPLLPLPTSITPDTKMANGPVSFVPRFMDRVTIPGFVPKSEATSTAIENNLSVIDRQLEELKSKISSVVGKKSRLLTLTEGDEVALTSSFQCLICKGILTRPVFASCCKSLIACKICWDWNFAESGMTNICLKCRSKSGEMLEVNAMDEGLNVIKLFLNTP